MSKIKFKYFEDESGNRHTSIKCNAGCIDDSLDDLVIQLVIIDDDIYLYNSSSVGIKGYTLLNDINWDNGYEFMNLYGAEEFEELNFKIVGDRNSKQNLKNDNNVNDIIQKFNDFGD